MSTGSPSPSPSPKPRPRRRLWRGLAIFGGVVGVAGLVAAGVGYELLRRRLPDFLGDNLSAATGRPIKVGEFERLGLGGVRLGPSIIPPTEENYSWVKAQGMEVRFNPLLLVFRRTLRPTVILVQPEVSLKQGFGGDWNLELPDSVGERGLIRTELRSLQIRNANLAVGPISRTSIVEVPEGVTNTTLIVLRNVNLRVTYGGADNRTATLVLAGQLNNGYFQIKGEGRLDTGDANGLVRLNQLPIAAVNPLFGGNLFVRDGLISANVNARLRPAEADPFTLQGTARLRNGDIVITDLSAPIQGINGTLRLDGVGGSLENGALEFGEIVVQARGEVDLRQGLNLTVEMPDVSLEQVETTLAQPLPVAATGRLRLQTTVTGPLRNPTATGEVTNLAPIAIDRLTLDTLAARFAADLQGITLEQATLVPATGGDLQAQGRLTFDPADPLQSALTASAQVRLPLDPLVALYAPTLPEALTLGPLLAEATLGGPVANAVGEATWQLPQATLPGAGRLRYADGVLTVQDTALQVGTGTLMAEAEARLDTLAWQAAVAGTGLELGHIDPRLQGSLDTRLTAAGWLDDLDPTAITAGGNLWLSSPLPLVGATTLLPGPLTARFGWDGQRLSIPAAESPNLAVQGGVDVRFGPGLPELGALDFAVRLQDVDLGAAYGLLAGPAWVQPRGQLSFAGTLQGRLADPRLAGTVALAGAGVNQFGLLSDVAGPVRLSRGAGAFWDLQGEHSTLMADIAPSWRPRSLLFRNGDLAVTGQGQGDDLAVQVRNFDLAMLGLHPVPEPDLGLLTGLLNANAQLDLGDLLAPVVAASFAVARPAVGAIGADTFTGQVAYRDGTAQLTAGNVQITPATQFQLAARATLWPQVAASATLGTESAQMADLLTALGLSSYADFGTLLAPAPLGNAADLGSASVGNPAATLTSQALLAQALALLGHIEADQRASALLPALSELEGAISGQIQASIAPETGLQARFDFSGADWVWGRYAIENRFVARGFLQDNALTLMPLAFRAGETQLSLAGRLAPANSDVQVRAAGLPLTAVAQVLEIPLDIAGAVHLDTRLTGSHTNPTLQGEFGIAGARVNQVPLQEVSSRFTYQDAIFDLTGQVVGPHPDPLTFSGTVPYALPFMTVQPASNAITLEASLQDGALALINVLTPLVQWDGGQGILQLQATGRLNAPDISGVAHFNDTRFVGSMLGDQPLVLNGTATIADNQLRVESLMATVYDGTVTLRGTLPLLAATGAPADDGLALTLAGVNFNYADEVYSQVEGVLTVERTLLSPQVGGMLRLHNSRVAVGPELWQAAQFVLSPPPAVATLVAELEAVLTAEFADLTLQLDPATLAVAPLLAVEAQGQVTLNGPIIDPVPLGTLEVIDGWVNTVTAEFFLQGGRDNRVSFQSATGLDPYLDLIFAANVPLQRQHTPNSFGPGSSAAEIPVLDPLAGATIFDEIQIEAVVQGQGSRLLDSLTLTSNPGYPSDQLLSMLSGSYLTKLPGGGEGPLVLATNLLHAFTAPTQDRIGDALGLRQFRIGAATVLPTEDPTTNSGIFGVGLGVNLGITQNLSATLVQVLNQSQPLQFNLRYRLDENWEVRGSTNFGNENRGFVEYRLNLD